MIKQHTARIFLSDQRSVRQSAVHRSYSTFNTGCELAIPASENGPLLVLNDEELAGAAVIRVSCGAATQVVLLPVTGDLDVTLASAQPCSIAVGELQLMTLAPHTSFLLSNPFENEVINYLQICFSAGAALTPPERIGFDISTTADQLIQLCDLSTFALSIGRFSGRKQAAYSSIRKNSSLFAFVIAGAFEVQDRLLHPRDTLALKGTAMMEFEALSSSAILLVIEVYQQG